MQSNKIQKKEALQMSLTSNISHNSIIENLPSLGKPTYGIVWNVCVSQINTLKQFFVHSENGLRYIKTTMCSALESISEDSKPKRPLKAGNFVAARYIDGLWYRAKITKINDSQIYVCFIDFGDKEEIITEIKMLPKDFIDIKPLAYRCHFKNLSKGTEVELSNSNLCILKQFFGANKITANFFSETESYAVTLSLKNGKDVLDIINDLIWEGILPLIDDPINMAKQKMLREILCLGCDQPQEVIFRVEPFKSIEHFYIETKSCNTISRTVRNEIDTIQNTIPVLQPKVGQILIAKCKKFNKLYRVRLVWKYPDSEVYNCFLIDRGIFDDCSIFFKPNKYLRGAPPVKIHCSLKVLKQLSVSLSEHLNHCFVDELEQSCSNRKILELIEIGSPCVVDISVKDLSLSELIMPCPVKVIDINKSFNRFRAFTARLNCSESLKITDTLKCTKKFQTVENPELLQIYVAKFDEHYKRVKFIGFAPEVRFNVIAVDDQKKGSTVDVLYKLPKSIVDVKPTDLYCNLALASDELENRCCEKKFKDICDSGKTTFHMIVLKSDFENGHIVRLFLKSIDVSTLITI